MSDIKGDCWALALVMYSTESHSGSKCFFIGFD